VALLQRETQLEALLHYALEAGTGNGRLALVSGEAGVGKSSLVEELQSRMPDATWAWTACDGLFTPRPLAPLHDLAREVGGTLPDLLGADATRSELFSTVLQVCADTDGLLVLVIEDVQWADEATLDLLRFLGRRLRSLRVLLVVTFRDDALAPSDPLRVALGDLSGQRTTRRVEVPPLTLEGVAILATGSAFSPVELHRLTGGNPFFMVELLRNEDLAIPMSARDAVLARVATLGESVRHTLEVASLDGERVDSQVVAAATGAGLGEFDELVSAGLLRPDGASLRFRHELTRRAVESAVPPHRRAQGHRALLEGLLGNGCDDDARLAYHAEGAEVGELVTRFAPRAARQAAALGAHREAVAQYERALRFPPEEAPRELAELYDGYAEELALVDSWPQVVPARERAIQLWCSVGDRRREGWDYWELSGVMWRLCRGPESRRALEQAIRVLTPLGADPELARAYAVHALEIWRSDPPAAGRMLAQASAMADELDEPTVRSDVLRNVAAGEFTRREVWLGTMHEALQLGLTAGGEAQVGRCYAIAQQFLVEEFRFPEAERFWRDGIAYCDDRDITTYSTCLRGRRALALLDLGRWDEAVAVAKRVWGAREASPINRLTSEVAAGMVYARRGEHGALALLDAAVAAADGVDQAEWIALTHTARAEAHWLRGEDDAAIADLALVRTVLTEVEYLQDAALGLWERRLLGESGLRSAPPEPYATEYSGGAAEAAARWDRLGCGYRAGLALLDSGCDEHLREALTRFESLGAEATCRRTRQRMKELGLRSVPAGARPTTRRHPLGLTRREDEVLALLDEGLTNEQIAQRLVVSTRTVDHHVSAVLSKLGVSSRGAASAKARQMGVVQETT